MKFLLLNTYFSKNLTIDPDYFAHMMFEIPTKVENNEKNNERSALFWHVLLFKRAATINLASLSSA